MQHPNRAFAVFARVVNGQLEVYETMPGSKRLTLAHPAGERIGLNRRATAYRDERLMQRPMAWSNSLLTKSKQRLSLRSGAINHQFLLSDLRAYLHASW